MTDYSYINARIRSLEAELLTQQELREMLSSADLSIAIAHLKKTVYLIHYPEGMEAPLIRKADTAVRDSLKATIRKIKGLFKGDEEELIGILLGHWDVFNIKTLIRGKFNNIPSDDVLSITIPGGGLDNGTLIELYRQSSVQAIIDMLLTFGHSYVAPLKKLQYVQRSDLFHGEVMLDRTFFDGALHTLRGLGEGNRDAAIVKVTIEKVIDRLNLITAAKIADAGIAPDEAGTYFLEGGRIIPLSIFKEIAGARDLNEIISKVQGTALRNRWEKYSSSTHRESSLLRIERWMDRELLLHAMRMPRQDPLNIGLSISLIWKKINEAINLRSILRGIYFHRPQTEIENMLIMV